jgi:hypothetical protein
MNVALYWHCLQCGDHEPIKLTGDIEEYGIGDREKCITCGDGIAHVVTLDIAARYEQGRALGMSIVDAWDWAHEIK